MASRFFLVGYIFFEGINKNSEMKKHIKKNFL